MNKNVIFPTLGSDYINASWLHGHGKLKEFIITQHPTLNVKEDFWRMLWDHNAQTVVLLSPLEDPVSILGSFFNIFRLFLNIFDHKLEAVQ